MWELWKSLKKIKNVGLKQVKRKIIIRMKEMQYFKEQFDILGSTLIDFLAED